MAENTEQAAPPAPSSPDQRLSALHDRRKTVRIASSAHLHSAFVSRLRWVLPVAALGIVAVLMIWPKIRVEIADRRFAPSTIDRAALEQAATENRLLNANFSSVDSQGRPITITSSEAVQENNNPDVILLQNPSGTLKTDEGLMTAQARHGIYAQAKQHLTLNDDVVLARPDGTTLKTQTLFVELGTYDARTDVPVVIDGPQGKLTAQGMTTSNGGDVTVFSGPAKLILNSKSSIDPTRKEPAGKAAGNS